MAGFELYTPREGAQRRTWTAAILALGFVFSALAPTLVLSPLMAQQAVAGLQWAQAHPGQPAPRPEPFDFPVAWLIIAYAVDIAMILGWVAAFERRRPASLGFNSKGLWRFLRGYAVGAAFLATCIGLIWLAGGYQVRGAGFWAAPSLTALSPIVLYMAMFVVQGTCEEVWMRGWLMQTVASRHGILWGIVINSLAFGAMHLGNIRPSPEMWGGVANVALFGVFISLYACHERSLWGVCGWHAAWNWLLGAGFGLEVSGLHIRTLPVVVALGDRPGTPWWLSGGAWGPEASLVTTVVLLSGIAVLVAKGALTPGESFAVSENPKP